MTKARKSLLLSLLALATLTGCDSTDLVPQKNGQSNNSTQTTNVDLTNYSQDALSDEQKYTLAYMWHEEKLAYEIYLELNDIYPQNQLRQIANNSEIKHIALVEDLVEWYDLNISNVGGDYMVRYDATELAAMPRGVFAIDAIQNLYDTLYAKGQRSAQDALEVGCMVEVVDVTDLDEDILIAGDNQAIVDTFNILRDGSYKHYWAFDKGLKNMGVSDGCCSLGTTYCKPDYPQQ